MTPNYEIIKMISEGPETQPEVRVGLHKALDYGARYALASGFVMTALDGEWKRLGGKPSDPTPWRKEMK
jgi:hypothetical protein